MSFQATINLDGNTFDLLYYRSELDQASTDSGEPASKVKSGKVIFIVEGGNDDTFSSWMLSEGKDGFINLYSYDEPGAVFKKIEFSGSYLTHFIESFTIEKDMGDRNKYFIKIAGDEKLMQLVKLVGQIQNSTMKSHVIACMMAAEKICIDGVDHDNEWYD